MFLKFFFNKKNIFKSVFYIERYIIYRGRIFRESTERKIVIDSSIVINFMRISPLRSESIWTTFQLKNNVYIIVHV